MGGSFRPCGRGSANRRGIPFGIRPLRHARRRRAAASGQHRPLRNVLPADRRAAGRHHHGGTGRRSTAAADRPRHLPPFGERRLGLHASGQRYPRSRRRGRPHAARIPHLSLHPPRTQRRDARPAPLEDSAVAGRRTGAAAGLRQQLPRLPAPAPHRRLFGGARSRLDAQIRRAETRHRGRKLLQRRRADHRRLRHLRSER